MDISVDELLPFCNKCDGSGKMRNPELDKRQGNTYGTHIIGPSHVDCDECKGKGIKLTKAGEALIEFINRAKNKHLIRF